MEIEEGSCFTRVASLLAKEGSKYSARLRAQRYRQRSKDFTSADLESKVSDDATEELPVLEKVSADLESKVSAGEEKELPVLLECKYDYKLGAANLFYEGTWLTAEKLSQQTPLMGSGSAVLAHFPNCTAQVRGLWWGALGQRSLSYVPDMRFALQCHAVPKIVLPLFLLHGVVVHSLKLHGFATAVGQCSRTYLCLSFSPLLARHTQGRQKDQQQQA